MNSGFQDFFSQNRFYKIAVIALVLMALSYTIEVLFLPSLIILGILLVYTFIDFLILHQLKNPLGCARELPLMMSLGDENEVHLTLSNKVRTRLHVKIYDELPFQLQQRDLMLEADIRGLEKQMLTYKVRPLTRGNYQFGKIVLVVFSPIGLVSRRIKMDAETSVAVFPSIIQMKQLEIRATSNFTAFLGIKRIRRIGHSYEFEQIKTYTPGDDPRSINWKASSRTAQIMVNQYEDEKAQPVYTVLDRSRIMKMPFKGLSLLDYAINSSLVISNIALKKHDKAGLLTYSNKLGNFIKAEKQHNQLQKILYALYAEKESDAEANYELLYSAVRNFIKSRSLILLYTNFESIYGLQRVLPLLRKINQLHMLVVMFFENTELSDYGQIESQNLLEIYQQTAARNLIQQKALIYQELKNHGIQSVISKPEEVSVNSINKYLELKARGYI